MVLSYQNLEVIISINGDLSYQKFRVINISGLDFMIKSSQLSA